MCADEVRGRAGAVSCSSLDQLLKDAYVPSNQQFIMSDKFLWAHSNKNNPFAILVYRFQCSDPLSMELCVIYGELGERKCIIHAQYISHINIAFYGHLV